MLPVREPLAVDPQQVAQEAGVAAVGFLLRPRRRLRDDDFAAAVLAKHLDQPRVHAAHLKDGHEPALRLGFRRKFGKKLLGLSPQRAHLPFEDRFAILSANIYRELAFVLVDTKL